MFSNELIDITDIRKTKMQRSLRFFIDLSLLRKSSFLKQQHSQMYLHSHHCWPTDAMDVIWTASAVKGIQFEVLNSVLIRQDTRAAGVVIKMQMRHLMHLVFHSQILLQMFTQLAMM